jgi:hypothetical protein
MCNELQTTLPNRAASLLSVRGVILALVIEAIVGLTGCVYDQHIDRRISVIRFCPCNVGDIATVFGEASWGVRESIMVSNPSPEKHVGFSVSDLIQIFETDKLRAYLHPGPGSEHELKYAGLWKFTKIQIPKWMRIADVNIGLRPCITDSTCTAVRPEIPDIDSLESFIVGGQDLSNGWTISGDCCSLGRKIDLVSNVSDPQEQATEYHHHHSSESSPNGSFASKHGIVYFVHCALIAVVIIFAAAFYLGFIGFSMHALETSSRLCYLAAPVCAIVAYHLTNLVWFLWN